MEDQLTQNGPLPTVSGNTLSDALSAWAAGVTLVTIVDDRDDIGTTVSAFCPVSLDPPIVLVSLLAGSYPAEVLSRPSLPAAGFAVTLLSASQKMLAGRFAAAGRPSARHLLDDVPHERGGLSGALIPSGGLAALECSVMRRVPAGDHLLVISAVTSVAYVTEAGDPLIRFRARYPVLPALLSYPFARLPAVAVDDLVEGAAVRVPDQRERLIRGVAKRNQVGAEPVVGKTKQVARHILVADGRVPASDAEAGRGQHDAHRGLAQVVLEAVPPPLVLRYRGDQRDRGRRVRDMTGALPHAGQLEQLLALPDQDEVPGLPVLRGRRPAAGLKDLVKVIVGDRPVLKGTDVPPRPDGFPCLHGSSLTDQAAHPRLSTDGTRPRPSTSILTSIIFVSSYMEV
jgi:flavin reductase (DIM6/NTAB) family NADH-FMN oxidoreductase RutF